PAGDHYQDDCGPGFHGHRAQPAAGYRAGTGAHRGVRRVLREPPAVPERGLLLGDHLPGHGVPRRNVPGAVRDRAHARLAGPVGGGDPRPRAAYFPAAADLRGPRATALHQRRGALTGAGAPEHGRRPAPSARHLLVRPDQAGRTTVPMVLSASVWRLASPRGDTQPMEQASESRMWQMSRAKAMPPPIGSPVFSLMRRRLSVRFPSDWPVLPAWMHRL